jgi:hypothetical protein
VRLNQSRSGAAKRWLRTSTTQREKAPPARAAAPASEYEHRLKRLRPVYRLAEQRCANWCIGGICEGADIDPKSGRHFRWRAAGWFCLLALGGRCPYFESAVLPMEKRKEWPNPLQGDAFRKAARLYRLAFPETVIVEPETRQCPNCGKHRIEARKRCCELCRIRRRRATKTSEQQRRRQEGWVSEGQLRKSDPLPEPIRKARNRKPLQ